MWAADLLRKPGAIHSEIHSFNVITMISRKFILFHHISYRVLKLIGAALIDGSLLQLESIVREYATGGFQNRQRILWQERSHSKREFHNFPVSS
jgi:hypothetical protein